MLDTNIVSYILRGKSIAARVKLAYLESDRVACLSSISEAELRYGLAKIPDSSKRIAAVDWFLSRLRILPWGSPEAETYGPLRARQEAAGRTIGNMDLLIAAHAISVDAILVTRDKDFSQVPDLRGTENWASDIT